MLKLSLSLFGLQSGFASRNPEHETWWSLRILHSPSRQRPGAATAVLHVCTSYLRVTRTKQRLPEKLLGFTQVRLTLLPFISPVCFPSVSGLGQFNTRQWRHQGLLPAIKDTLVPVMVHLPQIASSICTFMGR